MIFENYSNNGISIKGTDGKSQANELNQVQQAVKYDCCSEGLPFLLSMLIRMVLKHLLVAKDSEAEGLAI